MDDCTGVIEGMDDCTGVIEGMDDCLVDLVEEEGAERPIVLKRRVK